MFRPTTQQCVSKLPLAIILLSGAFLRCYALDARSPWWDEMLVTMASRHSLAYIFSLSSTLEAHPPLYYLLIKAVTLVSSSDEALRFLSALFGTLSIYLLYRIAREFIDENTALLAAAFLCVNPLHLILSRGIRPYALHTALFLLALWCIARLTKDGRWRDLFLLCGVNLLLFWIHYLTYYIVAAQGLILAVNMLVKSSPVTRKQFFVFCTVTAIFALPIYIWFVRPSLAYQLGSVHHYPLLKVLYFIIYDLWVSSFFVFIGRSLADLIYHPVFGSLLTDFMYVLPLVGCVAFRFRKPKFATICLTLGIIPLVIILIMAPGYPLRIWHVTWITPLVSLCAAMAFFWLPGRKAAAPLLAAGGALFILIFQHALYYEPAPGQSTDFKLTAARLRPELPPGALIADASPSGFFSAMSWYFDQSPPNPLRVQSLGPDTSPAMLHLLSGFILDDERMNADPYVRATMGDLGHVTQTHNATIYTVPLDRQPIMTIGEQLGTFTLPVSPKEFYSHVFRLQNVRTVPTQILPPWYIVLDGNHTMEGGVVATQNNTDASFEFVLENGIGDKPLRFSTELRYLNSGAGSRIGLFARFDDEPFTELAGSAGPDRNRIFRANFSRAKPFHRLTLQVRMYCNDATAGNYGDNLRSLLFQGLAVTVAGLETAPPVSSAQGANSRPAP